MALTNNIGVEMLNEGIVVPYLANAEDKFYQGALVCTNSSGKLVVAADASGNKFAGIVKEFVDASANSVVQVIRNAVAYIPHTGAALTDIGDEAYATADDTIAATATNVDRAGIVIGADVSGGRLLIDFTKSNATIDTTS